MHCYRPEPPTAPPGAPSPGRSCPMDRAEPCTASSHSSLHTPPSFFFPDHRCSASASQPPDPSVSEPALAPSPDQSLADRSSFVPRLWPLAWLLIPAGWMCPAVCLAGKDRRGSWREQGSILGSISDFLPDPWPNDLLCPFPGVTPLEVLIAGGGSKGGW